MEVDFWEPIIARFMGAFSCRVGFHLPPTNKVEVNLITSFILQTSVAEKKEVKIYGKRSNRQYG
jgi:hypothetical protein